MVVLPDDSGRNFDDAPRALRDAERGIERDRAVESRDGDNGFLSTQPHDGTFAKLLFDLLKCEVDGFVAFVVAIFYSLRSSAMMAAPVFVNLEW